MDTTEPNGEKPSTPLWAWGFVAACVLIPIVSFGGAIPGAIGGGGGYMCWSIARNTELPTAARIAICAGVSLICWVLFAALAMVLAGG